jgi:hypothetical protein
MVVTPLGLVPLFNGNPLPLQVMLAKVASAVQPAMFMLAALTSLASAPERNPAWTS